jgi:histidine triad (HIT) family protein
MASIFSKIVAGEIPCHKIAENDFCIAFLDIQPLATGHVLVVPKQETDYIFDLEPNQYAELMLFASDIAKALGKAIPCKRVGMAVIGLEVPHAHVHLIPLQTIGDINFSKSKMKVSDNDLAETALLIRKQIMIS